MGLSGNPPLEIAEELRSLYDTVNLEKSMEQISFAASERERENVTITIPVKERNLLNVIVKKFGWACVF
jgi:ATP-dependent protease HslVU (ClpYQ) ATPase subunit